MKKFYSVLFTLSLMSGAFGQCEIDFDFGDVGFGLSPDPLLGESLAAGVVDQEYYDVIHILIPTTAADIEPDFPPTLPVDSVVLTDVLFTDIVTLIEYQPEELGLEIVCNNLTSSPDPCTFMGGAQYCVSLQGVPSIPGIFQIDLNVLGWVTIFEPFNTPYTFSGFMLNVQCDLVEEITVTDADSDAGTLGSIDVNVNDSVIDAEFTWTDAEGNVVGNEEDLNDVGAGNYTLMIITNECTSYFENNVVLDLAFDCNLMATAEVIDEVIDTSLGSIDLLVSGATGVTTFLWMDANGLAVGTDEDLIGISSGSYSVVVTDEDGCVFELTGIIVNAVVSVYDVHASTVWTLMPNPANETFTISSDLFEDTRLTVLDVSGRIVLRETLTPNYNWDVSLWKEGVYFIQLSGEYVTITRRLVVQH